MTRFAVLGAGTMGRLRARSIAEKAGATLAMVCDVDAAAARGVAGSAASSGDWRAAIADAAIDAVVVSTPVGLHEEMCIAALGAGKHVLCEKPLAPTPDACARIVAAAAASGRTLAVGFNHRFYPSFRFVKQVVAGGGIGAVDHVRVFGGHDGLGNFRAPWMYQSALSGGGAMMDVGIHMTDLARHIAGEIRDVYAVTTNSVWGVEGSEDNALAIFRTVTGVPVRYHATWNEWVRYQSVIEVYGDRGMVRGAYAPMHNLLITQAKPGAPRRKITKWYPEIMVREKLKSWQSTTLLAFVEELDGFLARIGGGASDLADGNDGLRAVALAHACYASSRTGTVVAV